MHRLKHRVVILSILQILLVHGIVFYIDILVTLVIQQTRQICIGVRVVIPVVIIPTTFGAVAPIAQ